MNRPGSLIWLVRHQLRLGWREATEKIQPPVMVVLGLLVFVGLPALVFWIMRGAVERISRLNSLEPDLNLLLGLSLGLAFLFTLTLSSAMIGTLRTLFERGDLDLLLSSPLRPRTLFASRALGIAVSQFLGSAVFIVPIALIGVGLGLWKLLGLIPTLVALTLLSCSVGILLTLGLVRLLGVRRARTTAQVLAALIGAAVFLLFQLPNLMGNRSFANWAVNWPNAVRSLEGNPLLALSSPLWFPARGVLLEPLPLLLFLGVSGALFALSVRLTERFYLKGVQNEVRGNRRTAASSTARGATFSSGLFLAVFRKEWRMVLRDPQLLSQTLVQALYILPMLLIFGRGGEGSSGFALLQAPVLTAALILTGATLVGNLARLAISAEDAPDLLRLAPRAPGRIDLLKLAAIVLPIYAIFAVFFGLLASRDLLLLAGVLCFVGATLGAGVLELWYPQPVRRSDIYRSGGQHGRLWLGIGQFLILIGWVGAMYGLEFGNAWGLLGLAVGLLIPALAFFARGRGSRRPAPQRPGPKGELRSS